MIIDNNLTAQAVEIPETEEAKETIYLRPSKDQKYLTRKCWFCGNNLPGRFKGESYISYPGHVDTDNGYTVKCKCGKIFQFVWM